MNALRPSRPMPLMPIFLYIGTLIAMLGGSFTPWGGTSRNAYAMVETHLSGNSRASFAANPKNSSLCIRSKK